MGPHVRHRIRRITLMPIVALRLHLVIATCAHSLLSASTSDNDSKCRPPWPSTEHPVAGGDHGCHPTHLHRLIGCEAFVLPESVVPQIAQLTYSAAPQRDWS